MKQISVGVTHVVWFSIGMVLIALIQCPYFKQLLDLPAIIGIRLILMGIATINTFFSVSVAKC
ncbi:MAG: SMR family transporter [Candidatus Poribacteria bacterium]|nr:SMR family transporter [Candidatus Poribacteria bacterium]MDP6745760.1 SMR family transporter [Candidatus Poribacteria bacterium]MDP6996123.1 SMR family transporter [Candidatus Poribacteria bacterium]